MVESVETSTKLLKATFALIDKNDFTKDDPEMALSIASTLKLQILLQNTADQGDKIVEKLRSSNKDLAQLGAQFHSYVLAFQQYANQKEADIEKDLLIVRAAVYATCGLTSVAVCIVAGIFTIGVACVAYGVACFGAAAIVIEGFVAPAIKKKMQDIKDKMDKLKESFSALEDTTNAVIDAGTSQIEKTITFVDTCSVVSSDMKNKARLIYIPHFREKIEDDMQKLLDACEEFKKKAAYRMKMFNNTKIGRYFNADIDLENFGNYKLANYKSYYD